ncbi:hypothetical protein HOG48_03310 [Candidatus Peregrinibacteria bacterium]|nr:hypothetical protein [Candidatus Peregrinibacteria bacterium]
MNLKTTEIFTVRPVGKQLIAMFEFSFADRHVKCERILGGCLSCESDKKQAKIIQTANAKLQQLLDKIRSLCPEIISSEKRFDQTMIYRISPYLVAKRAV